MNLFKGTAILGLQALALAALAGSALAETTPATGSTASNAAPSSSAAATAGSTAASTTAATASEVAPSIFSKIGMSYLGTLSGPSVAQIATGEKLSIVPDENGNYYSDTGDYAGKFGIKSLLTTVYKFNSSQAAGFALTASYTPVMGQVFEMADPYLVARDSKLIAIDTFTFYGSARVYLPLTEATRAANLITSFASYDVANYDIPNTKWSIGTYLFVRYNIYNRTAETGRRLALVVDPYINYQIVNNFGVNIMYDMTTQNRIENSLTKWQTYLPSSLALGASWDISSKINLSPFLTFSTGGKVNTRSTTVGTYLSASIL